MSCVLLKVPVDERSLGPRNCVELLRAVCFVCLLFKEVITCLVTCFGEATGETKFAELEEWWKQHGLE